MISPISSLINQKVEAITWPSERVITDVLLKQLSKNYEIPDDCLGQKQETIIKAAQEKIKTTLAKPGGVDGRQYFNKLFNTLIYEQILFEQKNQRAVEFVYFMFSIHKNEDLIGEFSESHLDSALEDLQNILKLRNFPNMASPAEPSANRQLSVAYSIKRLMSRFSIPAKIENGDVFVDSEDLKVVCATLEKLIVQYGGINLINTLQFCLLNKYDSIQKRFHIIVAGDQMGQKRLPSVPFGYLFNLALKHPHQGMTQLSNVAKEKIFKDILELSTDIVAVLDVEPFSVWDTEFRSGAGFVGLLKKLVSYDSNFKIPQTRSSDARATLKGLFSWVASSQYETSTPVNEIINFGIALCDLVKDKKSSVIVSRSGLKKIVGNDSQLLKEMLAIFSHQSAPNQEFLLPSDADKTNAEGRPLIKIDKNTYWLPMQSWILGAVTEALRDYYRQKFPRFERDLGDIFEQLVRDQLTSRSIPVYSGKYTDRPGLVLEVDVALETPKYINFIEVKKKPLTRKSMMGSDYNLLIDLWQSLLDSQVQALRHENHLRAKGQISFESGASIVHNARECERISVVMTDFGSLQYRRIIDQALQFFSHAKFSHPEKEVQDKLDELNKKCQLFVSLHKEWATLLGAQPNIPFLSCWFLSLPQFILLLDGVKTVEEFSQNLRKTKHISFMSLDFYSDYSQMMAMQP